MFRPALGQFSNIWLPGGYLAFISNRIRKNKPLGQTCQFECYIVLLLTVFVELFGLA